LFTAVEKISLKLLADGMKLRLSGSADWQGRVLNSQHAMILHRARIVGRTANFDK
jgi:hypothetical protein